MLLEGSRLGRYQLLRQVGSGGMGTIFLAQDTHMPRQVAVKVVRTDDELQHMERLFHREMEAIARLDHPHILPVFDFGREKIDEATYIYLVMPFRPEGSLAEWLRQLQNNDRLPLSETAELLFQAAEALQHAHEHGIMHQDVKPPKFLLRTRSSQPEALPDLLLTDFGGGGILLSKGASHPLNIVASGSDGIQTAITMQTGQTQTSGVEVGKTGTGISTPAANQTPDRTSTQSTSPGTTPVSGGNQSTPGTKKSTPASPGVTPTPVPTPGVTPAPVPTPHPSSNLPAPPGGTSPSSASFPSAKWWVNTFGTAPGYRGGWQQVGVLYGNTNYVFCKTWGAEISDSSGNYNHWWMWTDLDTGGQGWVSAYYLSKWGNDVAKDNSGNVLPNC
jgi:hypothetical protein